MNYLSLTELLDRYLTSGMLGMESTPMRFSSVGRYSFVVTNNDSILRKVVEEVFL
jgi:hypothetical protein